MVGERTHIPSMLVRFQLELLRRPLPQNSPRVETQQGYGVSGLPLDMPAQMAGTSSPVLRGSGLEDIHTAPLGSGILHL